MFLYYFGFACRYGSRDRSLTAYPLSDMYFKKLESCNTLKDMLALHMDLKVNFATLVKRFKDERAQKSYIEACKNYIANHISKPFTLDNLAEHVNINKSYLSRRFTQE